MPRTPLRLLVFFVLLLVVRGLPSLLVYRRAGPLRQRAKVTFITATTMPLLIALARRGGTIPAGPDAAAAGPGAAGEGGIVGAARAAGEPGAAGEADAVDDHGAAPAE